MSEKYWQTGEVPIVIEAGRQIYRYYQIAQVLEICSVKEEDGKRIEIRRQALTANKLRNNKELSNLLLNFLEDAELIQTVKE